MWENLTKIGGVTNTVTLPTDGVVSVVVPPGVELCAYINGEIAPMHHLHTKAGDKLYFQLDKSSDNVSDVEIMYNGEKHILSIIPESVMLNTDNITGTTSVNNMYDEVETKSNGTMYHNHKHYNSAEQGNEMTPAETINLFANPGMGNQNGGAMGAGLGAGLLGGVLGGALLGGNGGGILGGRNGVAEGVVTPSLLSSELNRVQDNSNFAVAASERLTAARFDSEAQREIQAAIERTAAATQLAGAVQSAALGVEIAKGNGEINTQNALNAAALGVQVQKTAGDTQTGVALQGAALGVQIEKTASAIVVGQKDALITNNAQFAQAQLTALQNAAIASRELAATQYTLATAIKSDGDLTRGILIANNDAELNRRLITAQNEIIELRGDRNNYQRGHDQETRITQTVTTNQNQIQAQQQQQQQFQATNGLLQALLNQAQIAQATNQQLIIGNTGYAAGGPQTANPTNVRA